MHPVSAKGGDAHVTTLRRDVSFLERDSEDEVGGFFSPGVPVA